MSDISISRQKPTAVRKTLRAFSNPVLWIGFFGCLPLLTLRVLTIPSLKKQCDFALYWAAGRLFATGHNPYSAFSMVALERSLGLSYVQPLVFCPPWVLPVGALAAAVPYFDARFGWLVLSFLLDCVSSVALWSYFGGERRRAWIALAMVATFLPMSTAEYVGQMTPLILAFVVAFLFLLGRQRYFAAGLMLFGFGLKPHLLYLVSLAVVLWVFQHRKWAVLAGAGIAFCAAISAVFIYNPQTLGYLHSIWGPATQPLNGAGGLLRILFGARHVWLQFLPSAIGSLWLIVYWWRNRNQWDWKEHLPLVLLVSLCSAPYVWYYDYLLAMPALIFVAVKTRDRLPLLVPGWLAVQCVILFCAGVSQALEATAGVLWIAFYFHARAVRLRNYPPLPLIESSGAA